MTRWIDTLECNAAAYFCELLGLLVDRGGSVGISSLTEDERRQAGDIGYQITSGGTELVVEALRELPRPKVPAPKTLSTSCSKDSQRCLRGGIERCCSLHSAGLPI
ncbi:hypothetical protein [Cochlodiniinecator piscidefendens]|uniref:hypothetical protein n=1 Tax=Cochlodiniinecator piscidefendens TaxID=2715756 RepID=UPI00140B03EA